MSMQFHTPVPIPAFPFQVDYSHQLLSMGSCFAEHIGGRMASLKFQHLLNPFGIVYHPLVLAELVQKLLRGQVPQASELFEQHGLWRHDDFHSRYAHPDREQALVILQQQFKSAQVQLPRVDRLFITLGTAYGYQRLTNHQWVNNCHKQAASVFRKERAELGQIVHQLGESLERLKQIAPNMEVILTVSPVRHLRDGLLENQRSKAILLLASEQLCQDHTFVHYFPAYEILLDELRDYRFYATDMLHPSDTAIQYIWESFQATFFDNETLALSERIHKVVQSLAHRAQHPGSVAAQAFELSLAEKIRRLEEEYDFLSF